MKRLARSNCPVATTVDVMAGKWKPLVLFVLREGPMRFGQLLRSIEGASHKVLTQQLRQLERNGVVHRGVDQKRHILRVEYSLTAHGQALAPIMKLMCDWGITHESRSKLRAVSER